MPYEAIQVRKLRPDDTVTTRSLADGLERDVRGEWVTIVLVTASPATVILTVYDPDTRREVLWTGDPLHTVDRSVEL